MADTLYMSESKVVVLSHPSQTDFVELARTGKGRLFRKMILPMESSFVHPNDPKSKIHVDEEFAQTMVRNFKNKASIVQFPMVDEKNRHVEDPERNLGEVVDLTYNDKGVYAVIDVRKHAEDVGSTILGASAMLNLNYEDTLSGQKIGPTLLHVAATNRPYLTQLEPFEEIALSNADTDDVVLLTPQTQADEESEKPMELSELLAELKDKHGIDVDDLRSRAEGTGELVTALSNVVRAANPDLISLSSDDATPSITDVAEGVVSLSRELVAKREENVELSAKLETYETAQAETDVDTAIREGKIVPAQREVMLEVRLSHPDLYGKLVPDQPIVTLSDERGVESHDRTPNPDAEKAEQEIQRLLETANKLG